MESLRTYGRRKNERALWHQTHQTHQIFQTHMNSYFAVQCHQNTSKHIKTHQIHQSHQSTSKLIKTHKTHIKLHQTQQTHLNPNQNTSKTQRVLYIKTLRTNQSASNTVSSNTPNISHKNT